MPTQRRTKAAVATQPVEVPTIPNTVCFALEQAKSQLETLKKLTEIVPKGTGETDAPAWIQTTETGIRVTYGHFGYGGYVDIPATVSDIQLNHSLPLQVLTNLQNADIVKLSLIQDGTALAVMSERTRLNTLLDDAEIVQRQIPDFLEDCYESFRLTDAQFSGLLRQIVFKSTDLSVRGTGLPVQIRSDRTNNCYHVIARDSAFGIIKTFSAEITNDVDVTLTHQFLKVVSDTLKSTDTVVFSFSEDMTSCKASIGDHTVVWVPVPIYEEYDLLTWHQQTLAEGAVLAEFNVSFNAWLDALADMIPHFKIDSQTNNITISFDTTVTPPEMRMVFSSTRIAVAGRVPYQTVVECHEEDIVTDGLRMYSFLKCGKQTRDQLANTKLIGNHMFVNIPEANLDFILPLR